MGIRFRKRIKIAKGLYINVSKSGLGLSSKGLFGTTSVSSRGAYHTASIKGTGISMRQKIVGTSAKKTASRTPPRSQPAPQASTFSMVIDVDENTGKDTLRLESVDGKQINDDSLMRKVKKTEQYKHRLEETISQVYNKICDENNKFIYIHTFSEKIITLKQIEYSFSRLSPQKYEKQIFPVQPPTEDSVRHDLYIYARENIKSFKFWTLRELRLNYIVSNLQSRFEEEYTKWENEKIEFEASELLKEDDLNKKYLNEYETEKSNYEKIISGDDSYIEQTIEQVFSDIELPVEFDISFEVKNSVVSMDIDLPEIEDFPIKKAEILQSGKLSIKQKPIAEKNKDYATSVFGLAFYFASIIFNITPKIEIIKMSGYTQRVNKKTGNIEDQYVYAVEFLRNIFSELKITEIDPVVAFDNFKNIKSVNAKYELKTISPEAIK